MKEKIQLRIDPKEINFFNRIMEGYEHFGTVTTLDPKAGIVIVRTTPDFYDEVICIVEDLGYGEKVSQRICP